MITKRIIPCLDVRDGRVVKGVNFEGLRDVSGPAELARAEELRRTVYSAWDWNFGASPPCQAVKQRRVEGCGRLEVRMDVEKGRVKALRFFGDFFSLEEPAELAERLTGCPLEAGALRERLAGTDVGRYFRGLDGESLLRILTE